MSENPAGKTVDGKSPRLKNNALAGLFFFAGCGAILYGIIMGQANDDPDLLSKKTLSTLAYAGVGIGLVFTGLGTFAWSNRQDAQFSPSASTDPTSPNSGCWGCGGCLSVLLLMMLYLPGWLGDSSSPPPPQTESTSRPASVPISKTPPQTTTAPQNQYRQAAYDILRRDGYSSKDQDKMVTTLTRSIEQGCAQYHCKPSEFTASACKLRDVMRKSMPDTTLASAANILYQENQTTLQGATDTMIKSFQEK